VTLLWVVQTNNGALKLLAAQGESVAGPIPETGNTKPLPVPNRRAVWR